MSMITFVAAGAGSGKTHRLTEVLYAELSSGRVHPSGVIATTFTKRAATELRERVRKDLLSRGDYRRANAMGQARVGTVNSVCGNLLLRFAFEAGQPTEQRVLDEPRAKKLLSAAVDEAVEGPRVAALLAIARRLSLDEISFGDGDDPWRAALGKIVDQARSNAVEPTVLRGFGRANADELLGHFPAPTQEDLGVALTTAIAAFMPVGVAAYDTKPTVVTNTYLELLRKVEGDFRAQRMSWSQWNKLAGAMPEAKLREKAQPIAEVAARYPSHPDLPRDLRDYLESIFGIAADALDAYSRIKRSLGVVDFVDQEREVLRLLDQPSVRDTLNEELQLFMVDEFQDTSPLQLALFLKLADLADRTIFVGDPKQAIYGFRGSDPTLMAAVVAALPELGGTKDALRTSRRSRPSLVSLVNGVFRSAFAGMTPEDVELTAFRAEIEGATALEDWLLEGKNKQDHQLALASAVAGLLSRGVRVVDRESGAERTVRLSDIAILARANERVGEIATTLRAHGIPCATAQSGLLRQPELVLALACLRRLADDQDTIATAEIVSLADCQDPEQWLVDRLRWIDSGAPLASWKEATGTGGDVHPILAALADLRAQTALLSPREAIDLVVARCGLARRALQWQQNPERARLRLANLDRITDLAAEYEDSALAGRQAATLAGFLLWLQQLAGDGDDEFPVTAVDAVRVLTHHAAKGLEFPIVILCDLSADIRDSLWDVRAESRAGFRVDDPLQARFIRYWPTFVGTRSKSEIGETIADSATGRAARHQATEEAKRLLYVSMTRARDLLAVARPDNKLTGDWLKTVPLSQMLATTPNDSETIAVTDGAVPFRRTRFAAAGPAVTVVPPHGDLGWYVEPTRIAEKLPLIARPSDRPGIEAAVVETVQLGQRMTPRAGTDSAALGDAIHACLCADRATPDRPMTVTEIQSLFERMGLANAVDAGQVRLAMDAFTAWVRQRWPAGEVLVESPLSRRLPNGQVSNARTDMLIRLAAGWILFDHKSATWVQGDGTAIATKHAGQLVDYRDLIEAVSREPVEQMWLHLPMRGIAIRVEVSAAS